MGGFNSGRYGGRPTISRTASMILDISLFKRAKLGAGTRADVILNFSDEGEPFPVRLTLDARVPSYSHVTFEHMSRGEDPSPMKYLVALTTTRPPYGGFRWWWICPRSNERVAKLYLPLGGHMFASREYYGLAYQVTRETPADRLERKARKINLALGGNGADEPEKPKGMRWATFNRKMDAWAAVANAADGFWLMRAARILRLARRQRNARAHITAIR